MWNNPPLNVLTNNHKVLTTWLNCSFLPVFHPSFALTFPTNNIQLPLLSLFVLLYFVYLRTFQEVSVVHTCTHTHKTRKRKQYSIINVDLCVPVPLYIWSHFPHILLCLACLSKLYGLCSIYSHKCFLLMLQGKRNWMINVYKWNSPRFSVVVYWY